MARFFIILSVLTVLAGCSKVDVTAPGVKVKVGEGGVSVDAPGAKVRAGGDGVKVDVDKDKK